MSKFYKPPGSRQPRKSPDEYHTNHPTERRHPLDSLPAVLLCAQRNRLQLLHPKIAEQFSLFSVMIGQFFLIPIAGFSIVAADQHWLHAFSNGDDEQRLANPGPTRGWHRHGLVQPGQHHL
jgi:hypothetical protein